MKISKCPICNSTETEGDSFDVVEEEVGQEMFCSECYYEWTNIYTLKEQRENEL